MGRKNKDMELIIDTRKVAATDVCGFWLESFAKLHSVTDQLTESTHACTTRGFFFSRDLQAICSAASRWVELLFVLRHCVLDASPLG